MKIVLKNGLLMLVAALMFSACSPVERKELGAPRNILESIAGTWKLTKATQVDEDASKKGFPYKELDITSLFPYTNFVLTLNLTGGAPGTFTTTPGTSPKIIKLASGNWTVDNAEYPKDITLTSGVITEKISLGGYPVGASNTLKLKVERSVLLPAGPKLLVSYSYEFAKQ
ncbi:MAG: DUF5004 domain-containing protein [Chitinophagaceae bacterium]|nr:DUF5004 domain-containing protein [Chitinophagaceae bacterium]